MSEDAAPAFSDTDGDLAVRAARSAVDAAVQRAASPKLKALPESFGRPGGVFTTLSTFPAGKLRGCVGYPEPVLPLSEAIVASAVAAAVDDRRFSPVEPAELEAITVEVSLLTPPVAVEATHPSRLPNRITVGRHGLIVRKGRRSGLLLPQVASEYGWSADEFLDHACQKAGLLPDAWRAGDVAVLTFEAEIFKESSPRGRVVREDPTAAHGGGAH